MVNSNMLMCLYTRVLEDTTFVNSVSEKDAKEAIEQMHKVYQGSPDSLDKSFHCLTDFNEVAFRCAYLFKYAPFHTSLTFKAMGHALTESPFELRALLDSLSGPLKVCRLGGGPGADVIGAIAAMHNQFGFFRTSVKLVDLMSEWELTFWSILDELSRHNYGPLSESMSEKWFDWSFMTADLQSEMSRELTEVLKTADVVTMIKFVSAAASKDTSGMIEKIFRIMKPGAFVLFVDNAAGGFKELISRAAKKYQFNAISTPLKHQPYINECFKNIKYGFKSCYESKVAVQLLMKSGPISYLNGGKLIENWSCNENFSPSPVSHGQKTHVPQFQNFGIHPKPVNNFIIEHGTCESPSNWHGKNFSPSSVFLPRLNRYNAKIDGPVNLHKSFESEPFCSPTLYALTSPNWPVGDGSQIYDTEYENESIEHELSFESPSNWRGNNFLPSSEISPRPNRLSAQVNDPMNLHQSFESEPFCSSTPHALARENWPVRDKNQIYDTKYENESFEHDMSLNAQYSNEINSPHPDNFAQSPPSFWQKVHVLKVQALAVSRPNVTEIHDSGYFDESFQSGLSWDSPVHNSTPHFGASHRLGRIPFKGIDNSVYNQSPLNSESPLHKPWHSNRRSFGILQHPERPQFEPKRSCIRQSKNVLFSVPPSRQCPRNYKAPKRLGKVLKHQYKPYYRKRSLVK